MLAALDALQLAVPSPTVVAAARAALAKGNSEAAKSTHVHVFFHTNRPVRDAPPDLGFSAHATTGWAYDAQSARRDMARVRGKTRSVRWLMQTYKYAWLLNASSSVESAAEELLVLIDTDTVVQCGARELASRFAAFGTPLVVGGEPSWWPQPDYRGFDPWAAQRLSRHAAHARYPNSGAIFGTPAGFRRIVDIFRRWPRYPCCPKNLPAETLAAGAAEGRPRGTAGDGRGAPQPSASRLSDFLAQANASASCLVEDQHCLQAALRSLRLGVDYQIDTKASLALNLGGLTHYERTLPRAPDGRHTFAPTNTTPCVLHFNGYSKGGQLDQSKGAPSMRDFIKLQVSLRAWVPSQSVELSSSRVAGPEAGSQRRASAASVVAPGRE